MVKVVEAIPCGKAALAIKLDNGKSGIFDITPFLDKGIFSELRNESYFKQVAVRGRSIHWPHEQDFCADTIEALMQ